MNSNSSRQERIIRIFTPVRCLNRDQMRRYHLGQMTEVEQHLVEHHLIDCDLCNDALTTLENTANIESYQQLSQQLSQYILREYAAGTQPAVRLQKLQQPMHHKTSRSFADSAQSYFWTIVFLAIGGGSVFALQQHLKHRPPLSTLPMRTADALVLPAPKGAALGDYQITAQETTQQQQQQPLVMQTKYSTRDTSRAELPVALKTDTAQKKKPVKDSALPKVQPADTNARKQIVQAPAPPPAAETPKEPQKEAPKEKAPEVTRAASEEKENDAPAKTEPAKPANGDDYLFRSAMQYQQQGDYGEAINQFRKLSDKGKYSERARYQMAICYRAKGQKGKARRLLRELANSESTLKSQAQTELNNMN